MINLLKSDIGEISKNIFDRINKYIISSTGWKWKKGRSVIDWFKNILNKQSNKFILVGKGHFCLSISRIRLTEAISYAKSANNIAVKRRRINHAKQKILQIYVRESRVKKRKWMVWYSKEITRWSWILWTCESFILSKLSIVFENKNFGLWWWTWCQKTNCRSIMIEQVKIYNSNLEK